jgi:hypothetical protein
MFLKYETKQYKNGESIIPISPHADEYRDS